MVIVELFRYENGPAAEVLARLTIQDANTIPRVEGRAVDIINFDLLVPSLRFNTTVGFAEDPEEWARNLPQAYNGPTIWATVTHDDDPYLPPME